MNPIKIKLSNVFEIKEEYFDKQKFKLKNETKTKPDNQKPEQEYP